MWQEQKRLAEQQEAQRKEQEEQYLQQLAQTNPGGPSSVENKNKLFSQQIILKISLYKHILTSCNQTKYRVCTLMLFIYVHLNE